MAIQSYNITILFYIVINIFSEKGFSQLGQSK